jgi:hypothetical protein
LYPIPADRNLKLIEIADHWSREISPSRTKGELFDDLAMAWWRGEFQSRTEVTRLKALRALFHTRRAELPFWVEGSEKPQTTWEHPDGSVDVLLLSPVPVPSADPGAWVDGECLSAYEAIAQDWPNEAFDIVDPVVRGVILTSQDFACWVANFGYSQPDFWALPPVAAPELPAPIVEPPRKKGPGNPRRFVKDYIADARLAGKRPTQKGLEAAARDAGIRGGRDARECEFKQQMGPALLGRGRPPKQIAKI